MVKRKQVFEISITRQQEAYTTKPAKLSLIEINQVVIELLLAIPSAFDAIERIEVKEVKKR